MTGLGADTGTDTGAGTGTGVDVEVAFSGTEDISLASEENVLVSRNCGEEIYRDRGAVGSGGSTNN